MNWFWNRCRCQRRNICLLAGGALNESEQAELENHLTTCADCRSYYREIKGVAAPLASWKNNLDSLEPRPAAELRWAMAIRATQPEKNISPGWWHELIWPCRHAWAGIAALWLVMWALNWERPATSNSGSSGSSASVAGLAQTLEDQRQILAELIPPANFPPAEPPRRNGSPPRSERQKSWAAC